MPILGAIREKDAIVHKSFDRCHLRQPKQVNKLGLFLLQQSLLNDIRREMVMVFLSVGDLDTIYTTDCL